MTNKKDEISIVFENFEIMKFNIDITNLLSK